MGDPYTKFDNLHLHRKDCSRCNGPRAAETVAKEAVRAMAVAAALARARAGGAAAAARARAAGARAARLAGASGVVL